MSKKYGILVMMLFVHGVWAGQDDNIRLLDEQARRTQQQMEQAIVENIVLPGEQPLVLTVSGQSFVVEDTEEDLTKALFISINHGQWQDVQRFLMRYKQLEPHAQVMVLFAEGALARSQGNIAQAEAKYQQMMELDPDFLRGKLELARVLFENKKNREAEVLFGQLRDNVLQHRAPKNMQEPINAYLEAIEQRQNWHGSASFGVVYNNNINKKSGALVCMYKLYDTSGNEHCLSTKQSEESVGDTGMSVNLSANKDYQIGGNHYLFAKGAWYGTQYRHEKTYDEHTLDMDVGYKYLDYKNEWRIASTFQKYLSGGETLYNAVGADIEYIRTPNPKNQVSLQLEYQYNQFLKDSYRKNHNGHQLAAYLTVSHQIRPNLMAFAGLNAIQKNVKDKSESMVQYGGRIGVYKGFENNTNMTLLAMYRDTQHQEKNTWIGELPSTKKEMLFFANYNLPRFHYKGMYPSIGYRYSRQRSNNDWFYGYSGSEWSIKLQKNF